MSILPAVLYPNEKSLIVNGFQYRKQSKSSQFTKYYCSRRDQKKCIAIVRDYFQAIDLSEAIHNHTPDSKVIFKVFWEAVKKFVAGQTKINSPEKIFEGCVEECMAGKLMTEDDLQIITFRKEKFLRYIKDQLASYEIEVKH